jgi:hypothetical protein
MDVYGLFEHMGASMLPGAGWIYKMTSVRIRLTSVELLGTHMFIQTFWARITQEYHAGIRKFEIAEIMDNGQT